jgi:hypothetical protein
MGEPVTTGMMIGAALGGGTSAIRGGNPLTGALIGGATGGLGGSFASGFTGAAGAPASEIMGTGAGFAGNNLAAAPTFMQQLSGGAMGVKDALGSANTYLNQNPFTAQAGMSLAKQAFQPDQPIPFAPAGQIQRGQIQPMDYNSLLNPQSQSVMRPQPFSLL